MNTEGFPSSSSDLYVLLGSHVAFEMFMNPSLLSLTFLKIILLMHTLNIFHLLL